MHKAEKRYLPFFLLLSFDTIYSMKLEDYKFVNCLVVIVESFEVFFVSITSGRKSGLSPNACRSINR